MNFNKLENQILSAFDTTYDKFMFAYDESTYTELSKFVLNLSNKMLAYTTKMQSKYNDIISGALSLPGYDKKCLQQINSIRDNALCRNYDGNIYILYFNTYDEDGYQCENIQNVELYKLVERTKSRENLYGLTVKRNIKTNELSFGVEVRYTVNYYDLINVLTNESKDFYLKEDNRPDDADNFILKLCHYLIDKSSDIELNEHNFISYNISSLISYYDDYNLMITDICKDKSSILNRLVSGKDYFTSTYINFVLTHIPHEIKQCPICKDLYLDDTFKCYKCLHNIENNKRFVL